MTTEHDEAPAPLPEGFEPAGTGEAEFPWPPAGDRGFITALTTTWRESVLKPTEFFRRLPRHGLKPAVLYYLIVGVFAEGARLFWGIIYDAIGISNFLAEASGITTPMPTERLMDFLFSPLWLTVALFVVAAIIHLFIIILVPNRKPIETTVRVFAYAYSPLLFTVVPFIGGMVGTIWSMVLVVIGLREAHHTTTGRALGALLIPLALTVFIGVVMALIVGVGMLL